MAELGNRVKETTTSIGTGPIVLGGPVTGCVSFNSTFNIGATVRYVYDDLTGNWEYGDGILGSGTITRSVVLGSSNSGALVNFGAGTKYVFCDAINTDIYEAANFSKLAIMGY
ncbi:hypothetical protein UFOVP84_33 [uncultured Caudovirales phage]|uniref:Uncharacterized protein n=1 Tax=uncultured Caudovirales phage TaxID=2100421 RepID=A0A6J5L4Q6_9CAUD|nr:hypothetical protein UFOVP84_33 [uncultured Caudovirales phage]